MKKSAVIPAKAGIQPWLRAHEGQKLDSGFRRNDGPLWVSDRQVAMGKVFTLSRVLGCEEKTPAVIPAKAGIQPWLRKLDGKKLDTGFRRYDGAVGSA